MFFEKGKKLTLNFKALIMKNTVLYCTVLYCQCFKVDIVKVITCS